MLHGVACLATAVSLIAGIPSLPFAPRAEFPASASRIVGRVIDARTRAGIVAVRVRLDDGRAETTTDSDGEFEFADVPAGRQPSSPSPRGSPRPHRCTLSSSPTATRVWRSSTAWA